MIYLFISDIETIHMSSGLRRRAFLHAVDVTLDNCHRINRMATTTKIWSTLAPSPSNHYPPRQPVCFVHQQTYWYLRLWIAHCCRAPALHLHACIQTGSWNGQVKPVRCSRSRYVSPRNLGHFPSAAWSHSTTRIQWSRACRTTIHSGVRLVFLRFPRSHERPYRLLCLCPFLCLCYRCRRFHEA